MAEARSQAVLRVKKSGERWENSGSLLEIESPHKLQRRFPALDTLCHREKHAPNVRKQLQPSDPQLVGTISSIPSLCTGCERERSVGGQKINGIKSTYILLLYGLFSLHLILLLLCVSETLSLRAFGIHIRGPSKRANSTVVMPTMHRDHEEAAEPPSANNFQGTPCESFSRVTTYSSNLLPRNLLRVTDGPEESSKLSIRLLTLDSPKKNKGFTGRHAHS